MITTKALILDLGMNLNRIGNWAADDYRLKEKRIKNFLTLTTASLADLNRLPLPPTFNKTFDRFKSEYQDLEKTGREGPVDTLEWAERMMTWGNILTHRSKLVDD